MMRMKLSHTEWDYITGNETDTELEAILKMNSQNERAGEARRLMSWRRSEAQLQMRGKLIVNPDGSQQVAIPTGMYRTMSQISPSLATPDPMYEIQRLQGLLQAEREHEKRLVARQQALLHSDFTAYARICTELRACRQRIKEYETKL